VILRSAPYVEIMKNTPPKLVICGNYGATNLGDEAILASILQLIRSVSLSADITVMSADPKATERDHKVHGVQFLPAGVHSFFQGFFSQERKKTVQAIQNCDGFLLGGGGLFNEDHPRSIFIWFLQVLKAMRLKKPLFCLGQSIGPLKSFWARFVVTKIFQSAQIITVRDAQSQRLLENLLKGTAHAPIHLLADPVFSLSIVSSEFKKKLASRYVIFSVRPWLSYEQKRYQALAQTIDWLYEKHQLSSVLVPFQNLHDSDEQALQAVLALVSHPEAVQLLSYSPNFSEIIALIQNAQAVIGMRLHSLIFSILCATPFIGLSYSQKVTDLVKMLDLDAFLLFWETFTYDDLCERFTLLLKDRSKIEQDLTQKSQTLHQKAAEHRGFIQKFLQSV